MVIKIIIPMLTEYYTSIIKATTKSLTVMKLKILILNIVLIALSFAGYTQDPTITPLVISPSTISTGQAFTISTTVGNQGLLPLTGANQENSISFTISLGAGVTNVIIDNQPIHSVFTITYDQATNTIEGIQIQNTSIPVSQMYSLVINAIAGSSGEIAGIGNLYPSPISIRNGQSESNDYSTFEAALPVTLTHFTATREGNNAMIQWQTTEEVNSDRFELMRSNDAKNWMTITTVEAHRNSTSLQTYQYLDVTPSKGTNYYRLKMIDLDGTFEMSFLASLQFDDIEGIVLAPNPVVNKLTIKGIAATEVQKIELHTLEGQLIEQSVGIREFNMQQLPTGLYIVSITKKDGSVTAHKVIKR